MCLFSLFFHNEAHVVHALFVCYDKYDHITLLK